MKITLVVLVVITALVVTGAMVAGPQLREKLSGLKPEPPRTEIRSEVVQRGRLVETVQAPGSIEPLTKVEIAAEVSARITELLVDEGDEVRKDQVICRLDDKDLRASLLSAKARRDGEKFRLQADQARLEGLIANVSFAQRELERMQSLYETGDVSLRDLDGALERMQDLETSVEATKYSISVVESSLAAAEADIERAQDGLDNTVIMAPMDGKITWLNVEVGEIVTGSTTNPGTRLMTIADLTRMVHKAEVAESDIATVTLGQRAQLHINAYPDEVFSGTVRQIAWQRSGNPDGTGYFETEIEIDLQGREIRSGLIANVDIEIEAHEGLVVPYQAIVVRDVDKLPAAMRKSPLVDETKTKVNVVYRVVDGKAVCTPVEAGPSDITHRVVLAGLDEGDEIVIGPYKVLETIGHDDLVKVGSDEEDAETAEGDARDEPSDDDDEGDASGDAPDDTEAGAE